MNKYNVGDRIKLIDNEGISAEVGATATIRKIGNVYIDITWDRNELSHDQCDGGYFPSSFTKLSQSITRPSNGKIIIKNTFNKGRGRITKP